MCQFSLKFTNILVIKPPIQGNTWDWIILNTSAQLTPQWNTNRIRVTYFLVKYINVYCSQIYTTTHKNKLESTQLKSFLPHFDLATWRWIICAISVPSPYISLENTKQLTEVFKIILLFVWSYGCTSYHSPGMNRKIWGTRLMLRPCPEHCGFCISSRCKLDHKDTACRSYRPVHAFTNP